MLLGARNNHITSAPSSEVDIEKGWFTPVRQYLFVSVIVVLAALIAVNTISSRVERGSVESRLEHESTQPARVGSFRVVEQLSALSPPDADGYLEFSADQTVTDRIVLSAFAGQSMARVDIVETDGTLVYSTDMSLRGTKSSLTLDPGSEGSTYVGAMAMSVLGTAPHVQEVVVTRVPIFREGSSGENQDLQYTFIVFRDVTAAIDVATASSTGFRILMVLGVMGVLFASLLLVVMRGHSIATAARKQLQSLLASERALAAELDERNDELKAAVDSKINMLSVVTHELNNSLTSISAFADILHRNKKGNLGDQDIVAVDVIRRGAMQMRGLVSDLLDYSRIEANTIELSIDQHDVETLARGVAETMTPILNRRNQTLELKLDCESQTVRVDRPRCEQVLSNLISNASKYSPEGSTVQMTGESDDDGVRFVITDQGIGISPEDQANLFTPFFRADNRETREVQGTGLGLMISRQIAELHGGSLTLESATGRGTVVTFKLPVDSKGAIAEAEDGAASTAA